MSEKYLYYKSVFLKKNWIAEICFLFHINVVVFGSVVLTARQGFYSNFVSTVTA